MGNPTTGSHAIPEYRLDIRLRCVLSSFSLIGNDRRSSGSAPSFFPKVAASSSTFHTKSPGLTSSIVGPSIRREGTPLIT
jgi:hypothetical protein